MSEDTALLEQIANEAAPGFSGDLDYERRKDREPSKALPIYKVWNKHPNWDEADKGPQPITPGIVMTELVGEGEAMVREKTVVEKVQAVILYTSHGRKLETGMGKSFRVVCQSHDGQHPSVRIDEPLCRQATTEDLVRIMSKWKGTDQAKIDANIKEVTDDTGKLQVCGIKAKNGVIELCPFGRRNEVTGKKGDCTPHIYVQAYDIKLKRMFKMELTGKAIWNSTFVAPFHEFFSYLRKATASGLPCYAFRVDMTSASDGRSSYLNITNWKPIENDVNRNEMKELAIKAKEGYERQATRLSQKAYEAVKALREVTKVANAAPVAPVVTVATPAPEPVSEMPAAPKGFGDLEVSFEEDDIDF